MTAENNLPFRFVESESFVALIKFLRPGLDVKRIPGRQTLAGRILTRETDKIDNIQYVTYGTSKPAITLSMNGWKNVRKENILGKTSKLN